MSPLKSFGIKTLSNPIVSTLHWSTNDILSFSNFLQKKFPGLTKKFLHFFFTTLEVVIWKSRVAKAVDLFNKGEKIFRQARKLTEFYFWANVMLRQSHVWASRVTPAQKSQGLRVFFSKTFQGLHFLFSGSLIWSIYIWAICPWNKFDDKGQCDCVIDIKWLW